MIYDNFLHKKHFSFFLILTIFTIVINYKNFNKKILVYDKIDITIHVNAAFEIKLFKII